MAQTFENILKELSFDLDNNQDVINQCLRKKGDNASCNYVARTSGVIAGSAFPGLIYKKINPKISYHVLKPDGSFVNRGDVIAVITGPVADILLGEKVALNFLRFTCGISSAVSKYKIELASSNSNVCYSGYSTPTLDEIVKEAFMRGGGLVINDKTRKILSANVLTRFDSYDEAIDKVKEIDKSSKITLEVTNVEDFQNAFLSSANTIRVNSTKQDVLEECASINRGRKNLEVIGEIDLKKVLSVAKLGYKNIIIPSLTDSCRNLSIDLCFYKRVLKK